MSERESYCHSTLSYRPPLASQLAPLVKGAHRVWLDQEGASKEGSKRLRCADDATLSVFIDVLPDILHHKQVPKRICPHGTSCVLRLFSTTPAPLFRHLNIHSLPHVVYS